MLFRSRRKTLIPNNCIIRISNPKANKIYDELKKIDVRSFVNCAAVTLRVFLELSVDTFIEKKGLLKEREISASNSSRSLYQKVNDASQYLYKEKIADETLDFMQDRVKKYDDYKNNDKVKSLYRLADKTLELDQRLEEKDADQEGLVERYMKDQRLDGVLLIDENLNCVYQAEDVGKMDTFWQEQMSEPAVKNMLEQPRKTYITRLDKEGSDRKSTRLNSSHLRIS